MIISLAQTLSYSLVNKVYERRNVFSLKEWKVFSCSGHRKCRFEIRGRNRFINFAYSFEHESCCWPMVSWQCIFEEVIYTENQSDLQSHTTRKATNNLFRLNYPSDQFGIIFFHPFEQLIFSELFGVSQSTRLNPTMALWPSVEEALFCSIWMEVGQMNSATGSNE